MFYTLGTAAKATGKSKTTIHNAIKKHMITAHKNHKGQYEINPAELHRVFPALNVDRQIDVQKTERLNETEQAKVTDEQQLNTDRLSDALAENALLKQKIELLEQSHAKEVAKDKETLDDLRTRFDKQTELCKSMTLMITDQSEKRQHAEEALAQHQQKGFFARLFSKA